MLSSLPTHHFHPILSIPEIPLKSFISPHTTVPILYSGQSRSCSNRLLPVSTLTFFKSIFLSWPYSSFASLITSPIEGFRSWTPQKLHGGEQLPLDGPTGSSGCGFISSAPPLPAHVTLSIPSILPVAARSPSCSPLPLTEPPSCPTSLAPRSLIFQVSFWFGFPLGSVPCRGGCKILYWWGLPVAVCLGERCVRELCLKLGVQSSPGVNDHSTERAGGG